LVRRVDPVHDSLCYRVKGRPLRETDSRRPCP
jgi:hypothetical protein